MKQKTSIYLCGPTLYAPIHVGNARSMVLFDVISEYHRRTGGVIYARNITDVDDKIISLCGDDDPGEWVEKNTLPQFRLDCASLGLKSPDHEPRASQYIPEMIGMIERMNKVILRRRDGLYFDPSGDAGYGRRLSNRHTDTPFAVWKFVTDGSFAWPSPWGRGRPGWHTECAAMIESIFGGEIDLHGGGMDLKFPHHENEIAQCLCSRGHNLSRKWLHVGAVMADGRKMAKSAGNAVYVHDLARNWSPDTIRTALLMNAIGKPIDFTVSRLKEAETMVSKNAEHAFDSGVEWSERQMASLADGYRTRL